MTDFDKIDGRLEMFQKWEQSEHAHLRAITTEIKDQVKEIRADIRAIQTAYDSKIAALNEYKIEATTKSRTYATFMGMPGGLITGWLVRHL